jgi:hypothetical protein
MTILVIFLMEKNVIVIQSLVQYTQWKKRRKEMAKENVWVKGSKGKKITVAQAHLEESHYQLINSLEEIVGRLDQGKTIKGSLLDNANMVLKYAYKSEKERGE